MALEEGNQLWKLRNKHGRDKLFETPELMWEAACEYFQWVDEHPFIEAKPMVVSNGGNSGSSIEMAEIEVKRPYTLQALCLYMGCASSYFRSFKSSERANKADFLTVISEIEETIYNQKYEGAASGFFNANIISRDLGLIDRKEHDHKLTEGFINIDPLDDKADHSTPQDSGTKEA